MASYLLALLRATLSYWPHICLKQVNSIITFRGRTSTLGAVRPATAQRRCRVDGPHSVQPQAIVALCMAPSVLPWQSSYPLPSAYFLAHAVPSTAIDSLFGHMGGSRPLSIGPPRTVYRRHWPNQISACSQPTTPNQLQRSS